MFSHDLIDHGLITQRKQLDSPIAPQDDVHIPVAIAPIGQLFALHRQVNLPAIDEHLLEVTQRTNELNQ